MADAEAFYKAMKEKRIGSTPLDIFAVLTSTMSILTVVYVVLHVLFRKRHPLVSVVIESLLTFATLSFTFITSRTDILLMIFCAVQVALVSYLLITRSMKSSDVKTDTDGDARFHRHYLTLFRALLMMETIYSILAVDYPIFPFRHMKTEMDVGVGTFILAHSFVSGIQRTGASKKSKMARAIRSSLPLLALGFIRTITTKAAAYQEHTSEYGVHWNFFFTLCFVTLFGEWVDPAPEYEWVGWVSLIGIQMVLNTPVVNDFIMNAPRTGLFSANREGILSLPGYFCLFVIGRGVLNNDRGWPLIKRLVYRGSVYVAIAMLFNFYMAWQPFRRVVNSTYVAWTLVLNTFGLIPCVLLTMVIPGAPSILCEVVNTNSLVLFLVANLGTGLVNMYTKTLYARKSESHFYLFIYMMSLFTFAWVFRKVNLMKLLTGAREHKPKEATVKQE